MQHSTEAYEHSTLSTYEDVRESGFHAVQDCPSEWAIGSDEAGERIFCEAAISDFLQHDSI